MDKFEEAVRVLVLEGAPEENRHIRDYLLDFIRVSVEEMRYIERQWSLLLNGEAPERREDLTDYMVRQRLVSIGLLRVWHASDIKLCGGLKESLFLSGMQCHVELMNDAFNLMRAYRADEYTPCLAFFLDLIEHIEEIEMRLARTFPNEQPLPGLEGRVAAHKCAVDSFISTLRTKIESAS